MSTGHQKKNLSFLLCFMVTTHTQGEDAFWLKRVAQAGSAYYCLENYMGSTVVIILQLGGVHIFTCMSHPVFYGILHRCVIEFFLYPSKYLDLN